jgi:hypothetical protein
MCAQWAIELASVGLTPNLLDCQYFNVESQYWAYSEISFLGCGTTVVCSCLPLYMVGQTDAFMISVVSFPVEKTPNPR